MPNGTNQNKKYSNRTRPIEYKFRVTQEEYDELIKQKFLSGCRSRHDFIMKMVSEGCILNIGKLVPELSRQGNNLNQLVKKINTSPELLQDENIKKEITDTLKEVRESWQWLNQVAAVASGRH